MLILVTGGAASGKSEYAEKIICARAHSRLYLATMQPFGSAAKARIARHRVLRAGKGFETIERSTDLPGLELARHYDGILLEDLGNLLANEIFSPDGAKDKSVKSILSGIRTLKENCDTLVVVSNEIFSDGETYPPETMTYIKMLAELHARITQEADAVFESVCGILLPIKGGLDD